MKYSLITLHILKSLVEESSLQPHFLGFTVLLCKDKKKIKLYVILIIMSVQLLGENLVLLCTTNQISHFQSFYKSCWSQHQNM